MIIFEFLSTLGNVVKYDGLVEYDSVSFMKEQNEKIIGKYENKWSLRRDLEQKKYNLSRLVLRIA